MSDDKKLSQKELDALKEKGYEPRGVGFAKDNKFVSNREVDTAVDIVRSKAATEVHGDKLSLITAVLAKNSARVKDLQLKGDEQGQKLTIIENTLDDIKDNLYFLNMTVAELREAEANRAEATQNEPVSEGGADIVAQVVDNLKFINSTLTNLNNSLLAFTTEQDRQKYSAEEANLEAAKPEGKPTKEKPTKEKASAGSLLMDLFTNPAVIAAFSGIAYMLLPKDIKEKITAFFSGFMTGMSTSSGEMDKFKVGLIAAATGLATYLGASLFQKIGEALITITALLIKGKATFGSLKKKGLKGIAKDVGEKAVSVAKSPAGLGLVAGGVAATAALASESDKPAPSATPASSGGGGYTPSYTPDSRSAPTAGSYAYTGQGMTPGGGQGMKPGGGQGLKMPEPTVRDAIKQAADRVGVDESIMLAIAAQESAFKPDAKADTSSAKGLFQFIDSSWGEMVRKYGAKYPELSRGPLDPYASSIAGALYIKENAAYLAKNNIPVNATNIYASHFFGAGGARIFLSADPNALGVDVMPKAAAANKPIFYDKSNTPRTVGEIVQMLYNKVGVKSEYYAQALRGGVPTATAAAPTPVPSAAPGKGETVVASSEKVEAASTEPKVTNNTVNGGKVATEKEGTPPPQQIPNPVASRGSLQDGTRHSTATA